MSTKAARGTKRTCQNGHCGARFYDLQRDPIVCPICGEEYVVAVAAPGTAAAAAAAAVVARKPGVEPDFELADGVKPDDAPEAGAEAELADIDAGDEPVVVADDETFLEEEEDAGSDVTGLVGGGEEPEEITLVGLCTDICVISNALLVKAFYPEATIIVDAAACAGATVEGHKIALSAMKTCHIDIVNE